jgi:hypothetical protein
MKSLIASAADRTGVPPSVVDLVGWDFISQIIEDLPNLLLPPIMSTLRDYYQNRGVVWIGQNVSALQGYFAILKQMYGAEGTEGPDQPMGHPQAPHHSILACRLPMGMDG